MNNRDYTIDQFIESYKREEVSYDTLFFKQVVERVRKGGYIIIQDCSILEKYDAVLKDSLATLTMTDSQCAQFFYNPKALSMEIYGTTELWFLFLHANELRSTVQFNLNPLKVYGEEIIEILGIILDLEKPYIDMNQDTIYAIQNN